MFPISDILIHFTIKVERYLPAKVLTAFSKGQATTVRTEDGENIKLDAAMSNEVIECNTEALNSSISDLINISDLNEMSILHNLRIRFKEDKIYTNISSILISVNPFKLLPLYTPEVLDRYRNGGRELPPHVFSIAYNAYNNMLNENADQSVVISGESGAGKSEATKLILQFLADVSTRQSVATGAAAGSNANLEQQILAANPILEAFGNAKTLRNNNSSRFGKLITVNFDANGSIIGGGIINYLLEKSRVVTQTEGERNYHVFYQLLSAAHTNPKLADELKLQDAKMFEYTNKSKIIKIDGVSDENEFEDVINSMNVLRFSATDQYEIWKIVAGVLHFGNVKFGVVKNANSEDSSKIENLDVIQRASNLWGVDPANMEKFLTAKNIGTREVVLVTYNVSQATDARDAMVKRVYAELFQIIVNKINAELSAGQKPRHKFIGVLDIFGFESFEVNSFEQLCINFCNEKLQYHFNEHIFKMEQTLYAQEGISIPGTAFVDNQPTLDLLELKGTGIFSMVDEEISVPKGSDEGVLQKILTKHSDGKHPNCIRPKTKDCKDFLKNFGILHYAGPVFYNISNFLEKNKDQLHPDIVSVLTKSSLNMIQTMFPPEAAPAGGKGAPTKKLTLGGQFKNQLNELVATLNSTAPHFVRCMKSNDKKQGNIFTSSRMQDQLRYAGLVEVCRIRKLGFPVRRQFDEFYRRYKCCDVTCKTLETLLAALQKKGILIEGEWARGKSRIFLRTKQNQDLELAREAAFKVVVRVVQKMARGYIFRQRFKNFQRIISTVRECIKKREEGPLTKAIDMAFELPWGGTHLAVMKEAKVLQSRLREEIRVTKLLESAIASKDINALKSAIDANKAMNPPFVTPLLEQASQLHAKLVAENECKKGLEDAINSRKLSALAEFIAMANKMGLQCPELQQAETLKARIEQENVIISKLSTATASRDFDALNALLSQCVELGLDSKIPEVAKASQVKDALAKERGEEEKQRQLMAAAQAKRDEAAKVVKERLKQAIAANDTEGLNSALQEAMKVDLLDLPEVKTAEAMLNAKKNAGNAAGQINAIINVLKTKVETGITADDVAPLANAVAAAETISPPLPELAQYRSALQLYQSHAKAGSDLAIAFAARNRLQLKAAMELAENLDMQIEIMASARELLRDLEIEYREQKASGAIEEEPVEYDEAEEARKKRQEVAKQARYDIKNYPHLRSADDFAKGVIYNKAKVKEQFLTFQSSVIPKSLLDMNNSANNKLAMQMHKDLLGYMGDKKIQYPAMLAQDILRKGWEYKPIRDEIYVQIIKQLTGNPKPESVAKGWQVMCMCVGTFPPSHDFENYLLHYIIEKRDKGRGAVVDYARYCLRTLEAMLSSGDGTGFVPSVDEITAYTDRPPILATIYLVDGNVITEDLPLTPDLNVAKVLEMCAGWLDLKDPRIDSLGLFVYDLGEIDDQYDEALRRAPYNDLPRTPRPLRNDDFMGDVIVQKARQRRKFKFVLKKKIFLPTQNGRGNDQFFERLIYLQAEDETIIQGNIDIQDPDKIAYIASLSMAVAFGEELGCSYDDLHAQNILDFIPLSWREALSEEQWVEKVLANRDALVTQYPEDLQENFLEIVQASPLYGMHWFHTHKVAPSARVPKVIEQLPNDILIGFNYDGMQIFDMNRKSLAQFPYAEIFRWGGSSSQFSLILGYPGFVGPNGQPGDFELTLITCQANDMASIILDHIRAIMQESA